MNVSSRFQIPEHGNADRGWPWQGVPLSEAISADQSALPKISIITPSFNQGQFIEETVRSVLLQGYPHLEYIVIDGASSDSTLNVLEKYRPLLSYMESTPDRGQTHAINKGMNRATGDILAFLNSDDVYEPGTLFQVADHFLRSPQVDFLCGLTRFVNAQSEPIKGFPELFDVALNDKIMTEACHIAQPSTFFRRQAYEKLRGFREHLSLCFDYDFWLRAYLDGMTFTQTRSVFSCFRIHETSKTNSSYMTGQFDQEFVSIYRDLLNRSALRPVLKRGLKRGLGLAASQLFVHLESALSTADARRALWSVLREYPSLAWDESVRRTVVASLLPQMLRRSHRRRSHP